MPDFSDADFGFEEEIGPIVMGWNTTEDSYHCCICGVRTARHRGPGFFGVAEDKKLKPICFECITRDECPIIEDPITNDQDSGNLLGLRLLFTLAKNIRTSRCEDMTLGELTDRFKNLAERMTGEVE